MWNCCVVRRVANYIFYVCDSRAMTNCSPLSVLVGDIVDGPVSALVCRLRQHRSDGICIANRLTRW